MNKVKEMTKATEVKEESKSADVLIQEAAEKREAVRKACGEEVNEILEKHGCALTAQMLIGERGAIPQVFIIDASRP